MISIFFSGYPDNMSELIYERATPFYESEVYLLSPHIGLGWDCDVLILVDAVRKATFDL
jgi:hypothetical protein